ncbi:MAG: aldo/keto reductase [Bacteroidales bacterium]|nr:aldo/keto reductase [Bacteroidales bacterium]MBN2764071.1 aldo/keto reductase [Bacteroidales bacterium]
MLQTKNRFGRTGLHIPPVIFGTSALGNLYAALDDHTKFSIVSECFKHVAAPVVFDSAGKYGAGLALEMLGRALHRLGTDPEHVIISNKLGWIRTELKTPEPTFEKGVWMNIHHDARQLISYDGIMECWKQGNNLLGGKYKPALVSVHDPDEYINAVNEKTEKEKRYKAVLEAYRALSDLKKEGKVRAIGVGAKEWRVVERISRDVDLDWVMFANSMTIFSHPHELLSCMEILHKQDVAIINSAVFNAGFLTGGRFFNYKAIQPDTTENKRIFKWREDFMTICRKHGIEPAVACVHFAMTPPGVTAISLNTSDPARIKSNARLVTTEVPASFYREMKEKKLINKDYPYLGI